MPREQRSAGREKFDQEATRFNLEFYAGRLQERIQAAQIRPKVESLTETIYGSVRDEYFISSGAVMFMALNEYFRFASNNKGTGRTDLIMAYMVNEYVKVNLDPEGHMEFLREITHRCKYMMTTSNPDAPDKPVYKEFINHSRPLKRYAADYPVELLAELKEEPVKGYVHWYFTFYDNASMTPEDIQEKIDAVPRGTKMYKNKIQGLRGKATGLVFCNFSKKHHVITKEQAKKYIRSTGQQTEWFEYFTSGLDTAYSTTSPDTIAMSFVGITNKGRCIVLDERVYNNASQTVPIAPSDTVVNYVAFLERNRKEWGGQARNVFVDSADQATLTECAKYKRAHPECLYIFNNAYKKGTIIDRIMLQLGWMAYDDEKQACYQVVDTCVNYIRELDNYSWKEDKDEEPEDANDHMINSTQYAWIPYKHKIGGRS